MFLWNKIFFDSSASWKTNILDVSCKWMFDFSHLLVSKLNIFVSKNLHKYSYETVYVISRIKVTKEQQMKSIRSSFCVVFPINYILQAIFMWILNLINCTHIVGFLVSESTWKGRTFIYNTNRIFITINGSKYINILAILQILWNININVCMEIIIN